MTPLLRAEVIVPGCDSASSSRTSRPASANARATASPTTPAPTTTHSTRSAIYSIYHANSPLSLDRAARPFCSGRVLRFAGFLVADPEPSAHAGPAAHDHDRGRYRPGAGAGARRGVHGADFRA